MGIGVLAYKKTLTLDEAAKLILDGGKGLSGAWSLLREAVEDGSLKTVELVRHTLYDGNLMAEVYNPTGAPDIHGTTIGRAALVDWLVAIDYQPRPKTLFPTSENVCTDIASAVPTNAQIQYLFDIKYPIYKSVLAGSINVRRTHSDKPFNFHVYLSKADSYLAELKTMARDKPDHFFVCLKSGQDAQEKKRQLEKIKLQNESNAVQPVTVLRGVNVPSHHPLPAKWHVWKFIPKCALWKAVCLTLDIEPDNERHGISRWLESRRGAPFGFPAEFSERLQIAQANVSTTGPIRPQSLYQGALTNPHGEVLLSEIAAFAIKCGWHVPDALRVLVGVIGDKVELELPPNPPEPSDRPIQTKKPNNTWGEDENRKLLRQYNDERLTQEQLATLYGVKRQFISKQIKKAEDSFGMKKKKAGHFDSLVGWKPKN